MNTDFIKWVFEKAGWDTTNKSVLTPFGFYEFEEFVDSLKTESVGKNILWPFALQRAIEGWNDYSASLGDKVNEWAINIEPWGVLLFKTFDDSAVSVFPVSHETTIDQAKEATLMWVWEKEQNK